MRLTAKQQAAVELLKDALPIIPPEVAEKHVTWYKEWVKGETLIIGDRRREGSILYEVYAEAGDNLYPPHEVPAIFKRITLEEWPQWVQPTGAHDSYSVGAKVTHEGKKYTSKIDGNTAVPGTDGRWWEEFLEITV